MAAHKIGDRAALDARREAGEDTASTPTVGDCTLRAAIREDGQEVKRSQRQAGQAVVPPRGHGPRPTRSALGAAPTPRAAAVLRLRIEGIDEEWPDPAGLGPAVSARL